MEQRLVLNSWKEIAEYMGRGVRTVQRYERDLRLPVHRPAGKSRSAVIAFGDEIDQWMRKGSRSSFANGSTTRNIEANVAEWQRLIANSEELTKRADTLKTQMRELLRLIKETERRRKVMLNRTAPRQLSKTLAEKSEVLQTKVTELSELITGGGRSQNAKNRSSSARS
jgi:chaperonin cofactor prefoldin